MYINIHIVFQLLTIMYIQLWHVCILYVCVCVCVFGALCVYDIVCVLCAFLCMCVLCAYCVFVLCIVYLYCVLCMCIVCVCVHVNQQLVHLP